MRDNDDSLLDKMRDTLGKWAGDENQTESDSKQQADSTSKNPSNDEYGPEFYDVDDEDMDATMADTNPALQNSDPNDNDMMMYEEELYMVDTGPDDTTDTESASDQKNPTGMEQEDKDQDRARDEAPLL